MLESVPGVPVRLNYGTESEPRLVGYVLTVRHCEPGREAEDKLANKCRQSRTQLAVTEWDVGAPHNPLRMGLWRALRRLVCNRCEPRRMSLSIINLDDFLDQALSPCYCKNPQGYDGLVVSTISHLCSDAQKGSAIILRLAAAGKHVIADDAICLSCCHPAVKELFRKRACS